MTWQAITPFVGGYLVIVGLMIGSFINLAADRLPRGESIVRPRSHCRECDRQLNSIDLLPVVGYMLRGGRCATCRAPIGIGAPVVEATCAGLMVAALVLLGVWPGAIAGLLLVGFYGLAITGTAVLRRRGAQVS